MPRNRDPGEGLFRQEGRLPKHNIGPKLPFDKVEHFLMRGNFPEPFLPELMGRQNFPDGKPFRTLGNDAIDVLPALTHGLRGQKLVKDAESQALIAFVLYIGVVEVWLDYLRADVKAMHRHFASPGCENSYRQPKTGHPTDTVLFHLGQT